MNFGRYKNFNWDKAYRNRIARANTLAKLNAPKVIIDMNFRLALEAIHRGPWRLIWALFLNELHDVWMWYGWRKWEWMRVHIFRLPQDPDVAEWERMEEEDAALEEMAKEL